MSKRLTNFFIVYLMIGLVFAVIYALFYHWTPLALLSPGFYGVMLTWPIQAIGLIHDFSIYGLAGKTL